MIKQPGHDRPPGEQVPAEACESSSAAANGEGSGPCSCLPAAQDGWIACASCGLPQAPGKAFCSFCGRRWVAESPESIPMPVAGEAGGDLG
jgi:hypothetical protein